MKPGQTDRSYCTNGTIKDYELGVGGGPKLRIKRSRMVESCSLGGGTQGPGGQLEECVAVGKSAQGHRESKRYRKP